MKNKIKHISQKGPTCGIYCLAMVLQTLNENKKSIPNGQKLAYQLFLFARDKKLTNIGEFFEVSTFHKFLKMFNEQSNVFSYNASILEFNNIKDLKRQLEIHLKEEDSYIIFPILPKKLPFDWKNNKNDIAHWIVLDSYKLHYFVSGIYSQKGKIGSKFRFKTVKYLFKRNQHLKRGFNWKTYYKTNKLKKTNEPILKAIKEIRKFHEVDVQKMAIEQAFIPYTDLKNKMIVVKNYERPIKRT